MKTLIVYNSVSGFTESYALMLKQRIGEGAETVPLKKFKVRQLSDYDRAVFMARVENGVIDGFKTVVKYAPQFAEKYTCVVAVGLAEPSPQLYRAVERDNIPYILKGIPLFLARGGFDASKLTGRAKLMVSLTEKQLKKEKSRLPEQMAMLSFFGSRTDKTDVRYLDDVTAYLESGIFTPPKADEETADEHIEWMPLEEFMPKTYASGKKEDGDKNE